VIYGFIHFCTFLKAVPPSPQVSCRLIVFTSLLSFVVSHTSCPVVKHAYMMTLVDSCRLMSTQPNCAMPVLCYARAVLCVLCPGVRRLGEWYVQLLCSPQLPPEFSRPLSCQGRAETKPAGTASRACWMGPAAAGTGTGRGSGWGLPAGSLRGDEECAAAAAAAAWAEGPAAVFFQVGCCCCAGACCCPKTWHSNLGASSSCSSGGGATWSAAALHTTGSGAGARGSGSSNSSSSNSRGRRVAIQWENGKLWAVQQCSRWLMVLLPG